MVGHALWFDKRPNNFHEDDGRYLATFNQFFCIGVSRLHPHIQQDLGGTLTTYSRGSTHSVATQDIFQLGKMLLRHGQGPIPRLHC
jgi:hypothetical protein